MRRTGRLRAMVASASLRSVGSLTHPHHLPHLNVPPRGSSSSCRVVATRAMSGGARGMGCFAAPPLAVSAAAASRTRRPTASFASSSLASSSQAASQSSRCLSSRISIAPQLFGISSPATTTTTRTICRTRKQRNRQLATMVRDYFSKDDVREGRTAASLPDVSLGTCMHHTGCHQSHRTCFDCKIM
jgi:hypothetical protein